MRGWSGYVVLSRERVNIMLVTAEPASDEILSDENLLKTKVTDKCPLNPFLTVSILSVQISLKKTQFDGPSFCAILLILFVCCCSGCLTISPAVCCRNVDVGYWTHTELFPLHTCTV